MKLTEKIEVKVYVYDIEVFASCCYFLFYNPDTEKYKSFEVSDWKNELYELIDFIERNAFSYFVGYNNINYDGQVITGIKENYKFWSNLNARGIIKKVSEFSTRAIYLSNNESFSDFREDQLFGIQLDLMKILHFDNKNRADTSGPGGMVSLKRVEFELDLRNVAENPVDFRKPIITEEEIVMMREYCENDVKATYELFKVVLGDTEHPLYKEDNQIETRFAIKEGKGINALNMSDSKIGDEIIKKYYCQETGLEYKELPRKGTFQKSIKLKDCIPKYVEFQTEQLKAFLKKTKSTVLGQKDKFKFEIDFGNQIYSFMKGGLHNSVKNKKYFSTPTHKIIDLDVTSYYVALGIELDIAPKHLDQKAFKKAFKSIYDERVALKPQIETSKKIKGIVKGLKTSGVSVYGKSGDPTNWMHDKQYMLTTCLSGEFSILMLIEDLHLIGVQAIMVNTDGFSVICPVDKEELMYEKCREWSKKTKLLLEYKEYDKMFFSTVNDYMAIDTKGKVKVKGDFLKDFFLYMNKSKRVVNLAIYEYLVNGTRPEDFIPNHKNIFDFCARQKANRNFYYMLIKNEERIELQQLVRYVVVKDGYQLMKMKSEHCDTNAAESSNCEAQDDWGYQPTIIECNRIEERDEEGLLKEIDYHHYVDLAYRIIDPLEGRKLRTRRPAQVPQLSLF